jgi:hypothetical protein
MIEHVEPIRWRENPDGAPEGAAGALRTYGATRASARERELLAERLAPLLANPPQPARLSMVSTIARMAMAITVFVGFALSMRPQSHAPNRSQPPVRRSLLADRQPAAAVGPAQPPTAAAEPARVTAVVDVPAPATRLVPRRASGRTGRPSRSAAPAVAKSIASPERELELLRKAQQALSRMPDTAEAYIAAHTRDYPDGLFVQEREMLRIELAVARGERAHSRQLARHFAQRFPGSTYQSRLDALLARDATIDREIAPATDTQSMDPR